MSHDAGISVNYIGEVTTEEIINFYLNSGWSLDYRGHIIIVPPGDKECFNWTAIKATEREQAFAIIRQKMDAVEVIGLILMWRETDIGVNALFGVDNKILFSLTINRRVLEKTEFTDVSWYLPKLLIPLSENNIPVEYVEWSEHV